jgi:hypothetical protein
LSGCTENILTVSKEYSGEFKFVCPAGNIYAEDADGYISCDVPNSNGFFMIKKEAISVSRNEEPKIFLYCAAGEDNPYVEIMSLKCGPDIVNEIKNSIEYVYLPCKGTFLGTPVNMNFGLFYCGEKTFYYGIQYYPESVLTINQIFDSLKCN